jgi:hypothetical protein
LRPGTIKPGPAVDALAGHRRGDPVPLLERRREIVATQAKERQIRKPADSVVENLPQQTDKTRDAVAAEIGVSAPAWITGTSW